MAGGHLQGVVAEDASDGYHRLPCDAKGLGRGGKPSSPTTLKSPPKMSLVGATTNLITAGLGVGILSLPWAMAGASLFPSVATIVLVMLLNVATILILVEAAERYQAFDLGALLRHLPGRWGVVVQQVCNVMTFVSVLLCLSGILVVVADSVEPFAADRMGYKIEEIVAGPGWRNVRLPIILLGAAAALPLCFLDQRHLSFSSSLGIAVNLYLFAVLVTMLSGSGASPDCCWLGANKGMICMFSTLMQCAIIQMCVLPMYEELEDRSPRRFYVAVAVAFVFLSVLFTLFSSAGYLLYGPSVKANIIQNMPFDSRGTVGRIGLAMAVLTVYPLLAKSMVAPVRHWEEEHDKQGSGMWQFATVAAVICSAAGACATSQLGTLNQMNGAIQVSCFIGVVPGFAGIHLLGVKCRTWHFLMYVLIGVSCVASLLGLLYTANDPSDLTASCLWEVQ